jgi:hypothetical protein
MSAVLENTVAARDLTTIATDYGMFNEARRIREWLWEISGLIRRLNEDPNPIYGCTQDGLVLIEYYGAPSSVGTPFGQWCCTGGGSHEADWLEQAKERLGLVMIQEEIQNEQGCYGPVWGITKDLDGNDLPPPVWTCHGIGVGFSSVGAINVHNLSPANLKAALQEAGVHRHGEAPNWEYPDTWDAHMIYHDMKYHYSKHIWDKIKAQIKFVAWDDRIDPYWTLVPLYTEADRREEGSAMKHGIGHLPERIARDGHFYSVRGENGERLLTLSSYYQRNVEDTDWHWVCKHIVGMSNRPPTPDEIELVEKLLAPRECAVQYDPNSMY